VYTRCVHVDGSGGGENLSRSRLHTTHGYGESKSAANSYRSGICGQAQGGAGIFLMLRGVDTAEERAGNVREESGERRSTFRRLFLCLFLRRAHLRAMPPTRSHPKSEAGSSTGPHDKTLRKRKPGHGPHRKSHVPREPLASPAAPGVQKLKAALRQTRRLLAKV
jgi:hypothetical protein